MIIHRKKSEIINFLAQEKRKGREIGLVPTMGALHEGHLSLVRASVAENDLTVCSVFVNPAQFNNPEDFMNYPVNTEGDIRLLETSGCNLVFIPDRNEIYDSEVNEHLTISFGYLETVCEGKYRPGHFKGVGLIVAKLFNIIRPGKAYFGQKDLQQFAVIRKLVSDLSYPIDLRRIPIVREPDGLAMSSRNLRISPEDRPGAVIFSAALKEARKLLMDGVSPEEIKKTVNKLFENNVAFKIEYLELVNADSFEQINTFKEGTNLAFCIAGYCRNIRLIDNLLINE
jgi:pantoate--beta-alanine ligase